MKLHLPKGLFIAVMALMSVVTVTNAAEQTEIWVNFGKIGGGVTEDAKTWNNILGDNASQLSGTYELVDTSNGVVGTLSLRANANPWGYDKANVGVLEQYLDYQAGNLGTYWSLNFTLDDIAATNITLNLYNSCDNAKPIAPYTVNGINYVGGGTTNNVSDTPWGNAVTGAEQTSLNEQNTVTVTGLTGTVSVTPKQTADNNTGRATLAGLSIVWDGSTAATEVNLASGINDAASYLQGVEAAARLYSLKGNEDNTSVFHIAGDEMLQGIQSAANTVTLTSSGAIGVNQLYAKYGTELVLSATLKSDTVLTTTGKGKITFASSQSIAGLSSTVAELAIAGDSTVSVAGNTSITGIANIADQATLSLKGAVNGEFILNNATGSGTIELDGGSGSKVIVPGYDNGTGVGDTGTVNGTYDTAFTGNISVKSGTLVLGNDENQQRYFSLDLSSLKSIDLDGGQMKLFGAASKLSTINVNTASTIEVHQASVTQGATDNATSGTPGFSIGELALNANLHINTNWRSVIEVQKLSGSGNLTMDTDGSNRVLSLYINSVDAEAGMKMNFANYVNTTLGVDDNSILNFGGTITNAANLKVQGLVSISSDISAYTRAEEGVASDLSVNGTDGYALVTGTTYYLVDNNGGTVTFIPRQANYNGGVIDLNPDQQTGDVTFVGAAYRETLYRVNTADIVMGGLKATATTNIATGAIVATGRSVTIAGDTDNATAADLLVNSSGAGNIIVDTDIAISSGASTQATGKLTINNGRTLTVGAGQMDASNISSFAGGVELAGGTLELKGAGQELAALKVTSDASLKMSNVGKAHQTHIINGITNLEADLELNSAVQYEHGTLRLKELTGSGDIQIRGGSNNANAWGEISLKVDKLTDYTGEINVDGEGHTSTRNYVEFGTADGAGFQTLEKLVVSNEAYSTVHGKGATTIKELTLANATHKYHTYGTGTNDNGYSHTISKLTINGSGTIATTGNDGWQAEISIGELKNAEGTKTGDLYITSANKTTQRSIVNLNGGDFAGTINVTASNNSSDRKLALNINDADVAADAEIKLNGNGQKVALGVGKTEVTVKGISDASNASGTMSIVSGKQEYKTNADFSSDNTVRTLVINTAGGSYSTSATVAKNLNIEKRGEGSQTFSGNVSAFNGSLSATAGMLAFTSAEALNIKSLNVQAGAEVSVSKEGAVGTLTVNTAATFNGGNVNANLTLVDNATVTINDAVALGSGTQQQNQVLLSGDSTVTGYTLSLGSQLTLQGSVVEDLGKLAPGSGEVILFSGVDTLEMGGHTYSVGSDVLTATSGEKLSEVFRSDSVNLDDYYIGFNANGDVYAGLIVPEPTTATLSLLALAGLCARRRRASR